MSQSLVNSLNSFSFKVFNSLNNEAGKSICFSPFSLMIILSMVMTGTRKDTEKELKSLLSYDQFTNQEILEMNRRYLIKLSLINFLNSNIKLNAANKVYSKQGFRINNTFTKNLRKYFSSELEQLDFGQKELSALKINGWVSAKTNNLIKNIIEPNSLTNETLMILINAIYFKGSWASQFPKSRTKKSNFTLLDGSFQQVDMMNQEQNFLVSIKPDGLKASICTMPYRSSIIKSLSASMSIILPDRDSSVTEIEQNLNLTHVFSGQGKIRKVNLSVPKFKMELEYELTDSIKNLGASSAFDYETSDFTGISLDEKLKISEIIQKTFVNVDEDGTEAAAVTGVQIVSGLASQIVELPYEFKCDRPFLFIIHTADNGILFMGKYVKPT